ncbi:hypothetical protein MTR_2g042085 [Medicago truncatula]|uniref:Uncharacterized protein n=1 Tax=Medicago truncatula TaxID=3880 RepID=A0A072V7H8_MEDTR|nr:hypothetical protein MTR_2g042085 [Medicago truncatula]
MIVQISFLFVKVNLLPNKLEDKWKRREIFSWTQSKGPRPFRVLKVEGDDSS